MTQPNQHQVMNFYFSISFPLYVPFDSAIVDDIFSFEPSVNLNSIVFSNLAAGFYIPCDAITVREGESRLQSPAGRGLEQIEERDEKQRDYDPRREFGNPARRPVARAF
jgi:hypothetical protein